MAKPAIIVEGLSKKYKIGLKEKANRTFGEAFVDALKGPVRRLRSLGAGGNGCANGDDIFWALKDVSFEVQPGEVVGIIGRNGAGKSTLLKILSRITEPTSGRAVIHGRVGSLLEVGTGFHPELTGRENIYLNGAILGMKKAEITKKFDEIVAFAEIDKFLDTPVKRYSSGMYVRLAFAVAAHLEPEILIVDEVLAVGDAEFQKKCLGKMKDVAGGGKTVLFVSHNMPAIERLCGLAIELQHGRLLRAGPAEDVVRNYLKGSMAAPGLSSVVETRRFTILRVTARGSGERPLRPLEPASISLLVRPKGLCPDIGAHMLIEDDVGNPIFGLDSRDFQTGVACGAGQVVEITFSIDRLPITPGEYRLHLWLKSEGSAGEDIATLFPIEVVQASVYGNTVLNRKWHGTAIASANATIAIGDSPVVAAASKESA